MFSHDANLLVRLMPLTCGSDGQRALVVSYESIFPSGYSCVEKCTSGPINVVKKKNRRSSRLAHIIKRIKKISFAVF
jgi:hypothetical protein